MAVGEAASVFSQLHFYVNTKNGMKRFGHVKGREKNNSD